ncbi:hypothetical protein HYW55_05850 [Candidatus Gottesmanbacteria bacterium]|nr:hypothetical protein [Candidatus Gottesmanbacteria bacterium]
MKNDRVYELLVAKMQEMTVVPPQTLGPLTFAYKRIVPYLKFAPWRSTVTFSFLLSVFLYFLLGSTVVKIASLLQFGF